MTLLDLHRRILETTALNNLSVEALWTCVANCFADLTSRGYRFFKEKTVNLLDENDMTDNKASFTIDTQLITAVPKDLRKLLYVKLIFPDRVITAERLSPSDHRVGNRVKNGVTYTSLSEGAIMYRKENTLTLEWCSGSTPIKLIIGYYAKLTPPPLPTSEEDLIDTQIDISPEFEDALVFYGCYFVNMRDMNNTEITDMYLSQYKYFVEDLLHELGHEDSYYENNTVIATDGEL